MNNFCSGDVNLFFKKNFDVFNKKNLTKKIQKLKI